MGEPNTPGEARKQGLRRSRWAAAGVAVGATAFLTGIIAGVNGAPQANASAGRQASVATDDRSLDIPQYDGRRYEYDDDEGARTYTPQQQSTSQVPSFRVQPQTRSGGS
jgi:hypothetical protein